MPKSKAALRVIIVDDEPIAREGIRTQLLDQTEVEIVSECANGLEAVDAIRELNPGPRVSRRADAGDGWL